MKPIEEIFEEMRARIHCELRVITPEWARSALERNDTAKCPNRKIDKNVLAAYKRDLVEGRWSHDGWDNIAFSVDGFLLNGQHRLTMVAETGIPIVAIVETGVLERTKEVNDTGKIRSFSDALRMRGVANYHAAAGITRIVGAGIYGSLYWDGNGANRQSNAYLLEVLEQHPSIHESAHWYACHSEELKIVGRPMAVAGIRALVLLKHPKSQMAMDFFDQVTTGIGCGQGSPSHALRQRLISYRFDKQVRPSRPQIFACIIHAWNSAYKGKEMKKLVVPRGNPEIL